MSGREVTKRGKDTVVGQNRCCLFIPPLPEADIAGRRWVCVVAPFPPVRSVCCSMFMLFVAPISPMFSKGGHRALSVVDKSLSGVYVPTGCQGSYY